MATEIRPTTTARLAAEALGTFILVFGGVGTAVLAGSHVGFHGIALAFGLTVVVGAYAFGPVSGGHFNPAVTIGLAAAGRFAWKDVPAYVVAQVLGGGGASSLLPAGMEPNSATLPRTATVRLPRMVMGWLR